jgi:protein-S-isoprenylcysteine O-methyltransferase Ste14
MAHPASSSTQPPLDRYGYNAIARHLFTGIMTGGLIFLGAGTRDWNWGWAVSISTFMGWLVLSLILAIVNRELLNERGKRGQIGTKRWDWVFLGLYSILTLVVPFVGGLDYRLGWLAPLPDALKLFGIGLILAGFALLTWSMAVNRNFEATVRIQTQRGHNVISSGPYHLMRHPGYTGVILSFIGMALGLGGIAVWLPTIAVIVVFVLRTAREDATLQQELPGYAEFTQQTRYRLLPGVW